MRNTAPLCLFMKIKLLITLFLFCSVATLFIPPKKTLEYKREAPIIIAVAVAAEKPPTVPEIVKKYFKEDSRVALAVFTHESRLKKNIVGYNCYYLSGKVSSVRLEGYKSTSCKKSDISYAWSVDCGIAQINHKGKVCPAWTFDAEKNIQHAHKMYLKRGFSPWYSYKSKAYMAYL